MKPILAAFVISTLSIIAASAQSVEYGYDACGNRVARQIVLEQSNKGHFLAEQQDEFSEEQLGTAQIRIYPNPTHGHLKVVIQSPDSRKALSKFTTLKASA
ncbi:MAG: hypothetical protein II375_01310 [Bacteroidales bacterium]|nr:hypothetical protein [Bacteroidales bacterium]